jgi:hypothetical protein
MLWYKKVIYILFIILIPMLGEAQLTPSSDFMVSAQGHYGYIMSHRNSMRNLIKGHIYGAEVNYIFRTDGSKTWQQIHNYPEMGLCFLHLYLANPTQLGNLEALYPYANLRLNKQSKKVALNLRLGVGLAYLTKPFDRLENHQNGAIGSHVNGFVNLRLSSAVMLGKSWRLDTGVGLTHASNGAISTPNLGLNMPTLNLGLGYVFGNKTYALQKDSSIAPAVKKWECMIIAAAGLKQLEAPEGHEYMAYGLQANFYKVLNHKNKVGGGLEMAYNTATKQVWANDSVYTSKFSDIAQFGAKASYSFNMNKFSLPVDFGVYIYKKQAYNGAFFHRIGVRYMATKHIIVNGVLVINFSKKNQELIYY